MATALTRDQRERYDIALSNWRADLLDAGAEQLDSIGHTAAASSAREKARYHRSVAAHIEHAREVIALDKGPAKTTAKRRLQQERTDLKVDRDMISAYSMGDPTIAINFSEPSPAELGVI